MPVRTVAAFRYASNKKQGLKLFFDGRRVEPLEPAQNWPRTAWQACRTVRTGGFIGKINDDNLGIKYEDGLKKENVNYIYSKKKENLPTGTCLILITPDSERTMCTFLGTAGKINEKDVNVESIKNSELIFLLQIAN